MNIPNMLTLFRFVLIPIFSVTFFSTNIQDKYLVALVVFIISGVTDVLDGFIARKFNMITKFGTLMDPLADKLMILNVLLCLCIKGMLPLWVFGIVFLKELAMVLGATKLYKMAIVIPSNFFGKAATVGFYVAIALALFKYKHTITFFIIAIAMAIIAFINYVLYYIKIKKHVYR